MTPQEAAQKVFQAARWGKIGDVKAALAAGADPTAKNEWQQTPLHFAAWEGHTDTARLLIEKGADLTASDRQQQTPLQLAALSGYTDLVTMLRDAAKDQLGHANRVAKRRGNDEPQIGG